MTNDRAFPDAILSSDLLTAALMQEVCLPAFLTRASCRSYLIFSEAILRSRSRSLSTSVPLPARIVSAEGCVSTEM